MGLREDFRNALCSIAAAVPDAVRTMRHGETEHGAVVQSSSRDFGEPLDTDSPAESARFIANAAQFPTLEDGAAVELDGTFRVVVAMKQDPVGATFTIGLSSPFGKTPATYTGRRRENGNVRSLWFPVEALHIENGVADNFANASAPTYATSYTIAIRREDWQDATDPEVADQIEIAPNGYAIPLKVSAVTRHDGWYILKCRTKD